MTARPTTSQRPARAAPTVSFGGVEYSAAAVSQNDAAKMLGLCRQSVAKHIARGELRCVRLGRRVLIPVSEIERILGGGS